MTIRALVVDDEAPARHRLIDLIARRPELELGVARDGREAIEAILTTRPGLVFLDIQMPELSGFDVVRAVSPERMPPVIFVTAHDRYALRAFEVAAIDYLLKPFDDARFDQAVDRARELVRLRSTLEQSTQLAHLLASVGRESDPSSVANPRYLERIAVRDRREVRIVDVDEITHVAASGPYAELHVNGVTLLHRERMQSLEGLLDPARFCRIHRSIIVNLAEVTALEPRPTGDSVLRLRNGTVLQVSRSRLPELRARLQID